jgi:gluconate 2-dehydrogenase gamma chain
MTARRFSRRGLLTAGAALSAAGVAADAAQLQANASHDLTGKGMPFKPNSGTFPEAVDVSRGYVFLTEAEAAFIEAAAARIIPHDELGAGAVEANVPQFLDRQLAGEFGQGTRWYMTGPWPKGEKTQGYQSRFPPAQMYRAAIADIDTATRQASNAPFAQLPGDKQDAFLKQLEAGQVTLATVDAKAFFAMLLQNVIEGFFSDPIYGGNKDMVGWKLIGFPGARYDQRPYVLSYGQPYPLPPVGITGRPGWSVKG